MIDGEKMMDKKDAINHLLYMKHDVQAGSPVDAAIDMAIEALKATVKQPETNADRIRQMTDEELAEWLIGNDNCDICALCSFGACRVESECGKGILEWLKQEDEKNDN